jgi:hypothetical protein
VIVPYNQYSKRIALFVVIVSCGICHNDGNGKSIQVFALYRRASWIESTDSIHRTRLHQYPGSSGAEDRRLELFILSFCGEWMFFMTNTFTIRLTTVVEEVNGDAMLAGIHEEAE